MKIYQLINIAMIIDAMNTFDDVNWSLQLDRKYSLKSLVNDAKYVIKQSFNFLRLLNSYVVDKGPSYNTKDRAVYYGTPFKFLKCPEEGQVYRIITWFCCQENEKDAGKNTSTSWSDNSFLSLTVPERCLNAAKI